MLRGLVENSVVFYAPLVYNAQSEFKQKSVNSNFRKSEAKQTKSVYRRTKIMFPQLLAITEQSPFWSLPVIYGRLLSRTRANWEINLRKERLNPDSELFFYWLDYLVIKRAGHLGRNRPKTNKDRFTQYDFLACDKLTPCTRARALTHPLMVCLIFSQVLSR